MIRVVACPSATRVPTDGGSGECDAPGGVDDATVGAEGVEIARKMRLVPRPEEKTGSSKGGPGGRASDPVVVIDLEAGVLLEDVGSDREGLLPSDWNPTTFFWKEEDVTAAASAATDQRWVPVVNDELLGLVLRSRLFGRLLQRLGFSLVD